MLMAKKKKKKRSARSRSKRQESLVERIAVAAAVLGLIVLPMLILFPMQIWQDANPQEWEQAQIVYADHARHSKRNGSVYVMYDADGRQWHVPSQDAFDPEGFFAEVQPGDELTIRYCTWLSGNIVQSIEGYLDYEVAAQRSRETARTDNYIYAAVLLAGVILMGYIVRQLNKIYRFFPGKGRA